MTRITCLLALILVPLAAAHDKASQLEGIRFVNGDPSWDEILGWAKAKHDLEGQRKQLMAAVLRAKEATLKTLERPLGKPFPWTLVVSAHKSRRTYGGKVDVVLFGEKGYYATLTLAKRHALVVALSFKRQVAATMRQPKPTALTEVKGQAAKTIFGMKCLAYDVSGNGSGRVWLHKPAGPLADYARSATGDLGRLDGSLLLACAKAGGIPIAAKVVGVKGMTVSGNELGAKLCLITWRVGRAASPDVSVPKGWTVKHIPPK